MKLILRLSSFLVALAVCASSAAQSIEIADAGVKRNPRPNGVAFEVITLADCLADEVISFPFNEAGLSDDLGIEAWASAGVDCTDPENRRPDVSGCWRVSTFTDDSPIQVRVRDIISQQSTPGAATEEVCTNPPAGEIPFVLNFLILNGAGVTPEGASGDRWPETREARFDVLGPPPPTNLEVGVGEGSIIINFDPTSADDLNGYRAYCDPPRASSAGSDAGADAGSTSCGSSALVPGEPPPSEDFFCGSSGPQAKSVDATGLTNFVPHNIAVAAVDEIGNVGPLSPLTCATPKPVTGFFEAYRAAGGQAGGGFCTFSRRPSTGAGLLAALALAGLLHRRRSLS